MWYISTGGCPQGYEETQGHVPVWHSALGCFHSPTSEDCAQRCNECKERCLSFEHSSEEMMCNLNTIAEPSYVEPYLDFVFCNKTGKFSNLVIEIQDYNGIEVQGGNFILLVLHCCLLLETILPKLFSFLGVMFRATGNNEYASCRMHENRCEKQDDTKRCI